MFDPGLCDFRPSRMAPICVMSGGHLVSVSTSLQNVLEAAGLRDELETVSDLFGVC